MLTVWPLNLMLSSHVMCVLFMHESCIIFFVEVKVKPRASPWITSPTTPSKGKIMLQHSYFNCNNNPH